MPSVPEGWQIAPLGKLCDIAIGGTPSRDVVRYWASEGDDGEPWVAISDMDRRILFETKERISAAGIANSNVKRVPANTVLMSFKLTLGRVAIAGCDLYTNEAIAAFRPSADIDPGYLYYALPDAVRRTSTDVAIKGATLNKASLSAIPVAYPGVAMQQRIAAILASLDTAIEATEALIEKHQQIKVGLMRDMFTRGVTRDGSIREPQVRSRVDRSAPVAVPAGWEILPLQRCLAEGASNGIYKPPHLIGSGALLVGQIAITEDRSIDPKLARRALVSAAEVRRFGVAAGDVLVARVFATSEGVGRPALVPDLGEPAVFESNMMRLRVAASVIRPRLLFEWLRSDACRRHIEGRANASNQVSVNQSVLYPLPVPIPPVDEQDRMVERVDAAHLARAADLAVLEKLRMQKQGLMQDLLTGKVPVHAS
jgi:type I restriction enzyme S subunit